MWPRSRSVAIVRTCAACTLESEGRPEAAAGRRVWNGRMQEKFEVIGTTVTTPLRLRAAARLAASLLTTTAGLVWLASRPGRGGARRV